MRWMLDGGAAGRPVGRLGGLLMIGSFSGHGQRSRHTPPPDPDLAARIDRACDAFEACWRAGGRPRIEDFLAGLPAPERPAFLRALIGLEIGLGRAAARRDYAERFPEQAGLLAELLALEPASAGPDPCPGIDRLPRRLRRRRTRAVAAGAAALLAAIGLLALAVVEDQSNRDLRLANERLELANQRLRSTNEALKIAHERAQSRFVLALDAIGQFHRGLSEAALPQRSGRVELHGPLGDSAQEFYRNLTFQLEREQGRAGGGPSPATESLRAWAARRREEGRVLEQAGRSDEALGALNEAHELLRAILSRDPADRPAARDLASTLNDIGAVHLGRGRLEAALAAYSWARGLRHTLLSSAPSLRIARSELAQSLAGIGRVLARQGRHGEAIGPLEEARQLLRGAVARNPRNLDGRAELAQIDFDLGLALLYAGQPDEALARLIESSRLRERLTRDRPAVASYRHELALSWLSIGLIHRDAGRYQPADEALTRALAVQGPLTVAYPGVPQYRNDLSAILEHLSALHRAAGRRDDAPDLLRQALAPREPLADEELQPCPDQPDLADLQALLMDLQFPANPFAP